MELGPGIDVPDDETPLPAPEPSQPADIREQPTPLMPGAPSPDAQDDIRHPDVVVQLTGEDGNAYAILGTVQRALRQAGHGDEAAEFFAEATSGDYNHLLRTCMRWVTVR
jgi:hypothetical protein